MALTRAQLLAGNQNFGDVLSGQPQGVIAGTGVTISTTGVISVDASTVTGLVKLNNSFGYNAYVWPNADGAAGEFLKTDGAGNLDWATPQGFAVVTVSNTAPTPSDVGELWFDCLNGTLNIYQNCVGTPSPNWFNVAQPGFPVDPTLTSASPVFTGGDGTAATPYTCTVTTTGTGTTVFVVNTVTVTGLAPGQYVPIVDTDAVTNGGRFSFSNNYADAAGTLTFQTIFSDLPPSASGTSYVAKIKVGYATAYIDATVNIFSTIPTTTWNPGNGMNTSVPGTSSATWNGTTGTVTSDGCVVLSTTGPAGPWSQSVTATNGQPLYVQWNMAAAGTCGDAASGTVIQGKVTSGAGENSYQTTVNRKPSPAVAITSSTSVSLGATVTSSSTATVAGINATAYITLGAGSTGTNIQVSTDNVTFTTVPSAPSTLIPVTAGQTIYVKQTVGTGTGVGYTANLVIGDSTGDAGAAATFQAFTYTATTTSTASFPNSVFSPGGTVGSPAGTGPNASPAGVSQPSTFDPPNALVGTASATWADGGVTLTGTNMQLAIGAGSFANSQSPINGNTVKVAWLPSYINGLGDGVTATGSFGDGTYSNSYTFTVDKQPAWTVPALQTGAATSTQQTTNVFTPTDFNCPVTVSFAAPGGTDTVMTNVIAEVNGTPTLITVGTTTVTLNPGDTLEILGDTGGTGGAVYGVSITLGSAPAQVWRVQTSAAVNAIQAPVMSPTGGPLNPAANSPAGITLGGGTYTVASGAPGPHTSSDWQLFANLGSTTRNPETSAITLVNQTTGANGQTWTTAGSISGTGIYSFAYGNGVWIAGGQDAGGSATWYSTNNGATWTQSVFSPATTATSQGIYTNTVIYVPSTSQFVLGTRTGEVYTSPNGVTWTRQSVLAGAPQIRSLAYSPSLGLYALGVGFGSLTVGQCIAYSSSLAGPWTIATVAGVNYCGAMQFANGVFLALGDNGQVIRSSNGTTWTNVTSAFAGFATGLAFGNGVWVLGPSNNQIRYSTDNGSSWNAASFGNNGSPVNSIVFASGVFYAVTNGANPASNVLFSADGMTWTQTTLPGGTPALNSNLETIAAGGGRLMVAIGDPVAYTSTLDQTTLTLTNTTDLANMQVGDTVVEVGGGADASGTITAINSAGPTITLSPSTGTWSAGVGATAKDTSRTITTVNQPLVSTNTIGSVAPAPASAWASQTSGTTDSFQTVSYGNGLYVAATASSTVFTSPDGTTWTQAVGATNQPMWEFVYAGSQWVGVGNVGKVITSTNGTSWTPQTLGATTDLYGIAYGNGTYVTVGSNAFNGGVFTSLDATTWTPRPNQPNPLRDVAFGNGVFVAVGVSGSIRVSSDNGATWTGATSGTTNALARITFAQGIFVAVGDSGTILTSPDGTTWTPRTSGTTDSLAGVSGSSSGFIVTGGAASGTILVSSTGTSWTSQTSGTTQYLYNSASGPTNSVIVGTNGVILTSGSPFGGTTLTISGANTDGFAVGNLISNGVTGASAASGTITAINATTVTVTPQSANWTAGQNLYRGQAIVNAVNSASLETYLVAQSLLTTSSTYYSRARYSASSTSTTSPWANWASFTTASSFLPAIGGAMNGGYFGGQINDGGIVYNLIVAPAASGQNTSGLQWKTSDTADTNPSAAFWQNEAYGFPASQQGKSATYPAFQWARNLSIGTYNDWYLPATNELEVLYYFLKPDPASGGTANNTSFGSNSNAVAPEPVSTNYTASNPAQTTSTLFKVGGGQEFTGPGGNYWSSTQNSSDNTVANNANFSIGVQTNGPKSAAKFARAIRREYANAPVAIGAAFGGGYFAGQYQDGGVTYNLIVAPVTDGTRDGQFGGGAGTGVAWGPAAPATNPPSQNAVYGGTATTTFANATYPLFNWCVNGAGGPNSSGGIGGFTDWYIPAKDELAIVMYNLGPTWTTAPLFKTSQPQDLDIGATGGFYWSATESSSFTTNAWRGSPQGAIDVGSVKTATLRARAVRRQLA